MNNIQYIVNKYFNVNHEIPKKENQIQHWSGLAHDLLVSNNDLKQYLTISIQDSINYDDLCQIFNNMIEYGHLFLKEDCKDVIYRLFNDFKNHPGYNEKRGSLGVVHIIDEGFIIIPYGSFDYKVWREYTLEDYENKKQEYVVCGIAKQEKDYIKDWVAYQLHIGFDKVYLYDNNTDERYDELLKEYIDRGQLEIIDVRDKKGFQNAVYHVFYHTMPFKYVTDIDIDEFIWIKETSKYTNIKQFIDELLEDKPVYGIMLQWKCYRGTHANKDTSKPIWELDNEPLDPTMRKNGRCELVNGWLKSIFKANYQLSFNEHFGWETSMDYYSFCLNMVDWTGKKVWKTFCDFNIKEQEDAEVFVKHFLFRNIQNVYYNKYLRGHAGLGESWVIGYDGWNYRLWLHNMNYYTDLVPYLDKEEQLFMRSKGMKINYTFHPDAILINNILRDNTNINAAVNEYVRQIQDWANIQYVEVDCDKVGEIVQPDYKEEFNLPKELYSFDFNRYATYNSFYCGHYIGEEGWIVDNKYQEQIVLCIGFPLEYMLGEVDKETQQKYIQYLKEFLCYNNIKNMFRQIIEHPDFLFVHNQFIQPVSDVYGWKDNVEGFLKENNLSLPQYKLMNNTFCTSLSNYKKMKDLQHKFVDKYGACDNWWLIENTKSGYTTPYHAMLCTMLAPIKYTIPLYFQ